MFSIDFSSITSSKLLYKKSSYLLDIDNNEAFYNLSFIKDTSVNISDGFSIGL